MSTDTTAPQPCRTSARFFGEPDTEYRCTLAAGHAEGHWYSDFPEAVSTPWTYSAVPS